ncbi:winged helix-turn-helix transcriptional regulator [Pseudactinotalea sp. Z1739]|uniref:winged helix-turn-helix transcriptional regulator n=1 Tax=Pseudactinotalea sp. Z1739 TaxID=3413028 RepID=UPI003C79D72A
MAEKRSGCPINMTVELLGDRWSLLVIRDVMFTDRHTFAELHAGSQEGIATNILSDRLKRLVAAGVLRRTSVPGSRNRVRYDLTERGVDLVPVLTAIGRWGARHLDVDDALCQVVQDLHAGGPDAQERVQQHLRERDLTPA